METENNSSLVKQYLIVFAISLVLYCISLAPSLVWQDSGMIQYRVLNNDISGGLGLALAHPLYYIISIFFKNIQIGDCIFRINFVTALASSFAVTNLFVFVKIWLGRLFPAIISALTLALSHTFWRHASIPETYNMYLAFFLAGLIFFLLYSREKKPAQLMLVGLFNGLAISVHMLAIIPLAFYGVYILINLAKKNIPLKHFFLFALAWIIGGCAYEYLFFQELLRSGDLFATLNSALFGRSWSGAVLNTSMNASIVKENVMYIGMNFPTINVLFVFVGLISILKKAKRDLFGVFLLLLCGAFLFFAFRYTVPDRYAFFLPFYTMTAILVGAGVSRILHRWKSKSLYIAIFAFAILPAFVYAFLPSVVENNYPIFKNKRQLPYRNEYTYFLRPWKTNYLGAKKFACEAIAQAENNSAIFADGTSLYPLIIAKNLYYPNKNIDIYSSHGSYNNLGEFDDEKILDMFNYRSVYVVSPVRGYCLDVFIENVEFENCGVLYKCERE